MLNICALVGMFEREPHVRSHPETGTPVVALTVRVEEVGKDGRAFLTYIPVECYGRCAAHAETLSKETCVAVEGKIGWKSYDKNGEKRSTLMGVARQISVLTLTAAEAFT